MLTFLILQNSVRAKQSAISCSTTADCAWGETCVAGDADTSVQSCVPPTVCGGQSMGNCPSDNAGELACLWRPFDDCNDGCAILNGKKGIYKCVSIARCDAYYGGSSCSKGCTANGAQCNGQGSCNMMETMADGTPVLGCTCDNGYKGERCEIAPNSTSSSNSSTIDADDEYIDDSGSDDDNLSELTDDSDEDEAIPSCASADCGTGSSTLRRGIRTEMMVVVITLTALALIGVILLAVRTRRKKEQANEEFADALAFTHNGDAANVSDLNSSLSDTSLPSRP